MDYILVLLAKGKPGWNMQGRRKWAVVRAGREAKNGEWPRQGHHKWRKENVLVWGTNTIHNSHKRNSI